MNGTGKSENLEAIVARALAASERQRLGLNMIAATRLYLHDVNIAFGQRGDSAHDAARTGGRA